MQGALVIVLAMVIVGAILYVTDVKYFRHHHSQDNTSPADTNEGEATPGVAEKTEPEVCCGMHLVCEKTSLSIISDEIIYYDDEELDRYAGRLPDSYSYEESEEFRDVLLTLLPKDVPGWAKSISLRNIQLPADVKDELMLILSENYQSDSVNSLTN